MNREIKFRAWFHESKKMDTVAIGHKGTNSHSDVFDLMQFTGLHDKNGVEIYEGDIVNQEKWVSIGSYAPSVGIVKYIGVGFTCDCIGDWEGAHATLNGNAEIIGNIYENPELLTTPK